MRLFITGYTVDPAGRTKKEDIYRSHAGLVPLVLPSDSCISKPLGHTAKYAYFNRPGRDSGLRRVDCFWADDLGRPPAIGYGPGGCYGWGAGALRNEAE